MKKTPASDYRAILPILAKKYFDPGVSVERQVTAHVRKLITSNKLAVHSRLPPLRTLAEIWNTNYFTVQAALSRLVGEGLIVQSPKKGSFVAPQRRALRRVCLYHDHSLRSESPDDFYARLNMWLYRLLAERGIISISYFDLRPTDKLHTTPPEIRDMAKDGEIDALITTAIYPNNTSWLLGLEVPVASAMMFKQAERIIEMDVEQMARLAINEMVRSKRKLLGLIGIPTAAMEIGKRDLLREAMERHATAKGIKVISATILDTWGEHAWEQKGYEMADELLRKKSPPDALFVFPDTLVRGVATALLQRRFQVPEKIELISHRNAETSIYLPFPVSWVTVKIEDFARALLDQIDRQIAGQPLVAHKLSLKVQRTS